MCSRARARVRVRVRVRVCFACSHFLIARHKNLYLSALRNGKEGGREEAATELKICKHN